MTNSRSADPLTLEGPSGVTDPIKGADLNGARSSVAARQPDGYVREVRRILGRFGTRRTICAGESLFDPADSSGHLYIVESGTIDVSLPDDPAHHPLASFHAGAVFLFDFGGYQVASLEAAEESVAIDLPLARMNRLCRQEMELRLLLRQCHAFDLKSFLDVCYPARSRFRLVHRTDEVEKPRAGGIAPRRSPCSSCSRSARNPARITPETAG